jgi:tetratricopeptide (TPR) repeat protein
MGLSGYRLGRQDESHRWETAAMALLQRLGSGHDRTAAWFYQDRGIARQRRGDYRAALADLQTALALKQRVLPPDLADVARSLETIANIDNAVGDHQAAFDAADGAIDDLRKAFGPASPQLAQPLEIRGESLEALGRLSEAEKDLRDAADRWSGWLGPDHEWVAYALVALGKTLLSERRPSEASASLERALRIREHADPNQDEVAEARFALARAQLALDPERRTSARKLAFTAREAYQKLPNHGGEIAEIDAWLAEPGKAALARR